MQSIIMSIQGRISLTQVVSSYKDHVESTSYA